jgi:hypothetical protein
MAFIVKGSMWQYSVDDKGTEHIVRLSIENWWACDRESFLKLTPSVYNIDACEETNVLLVTKADFMNGISAMSAIVEMSKELEARSSIANQKKMEFIH